MNTSCRRIVLCIILCFIAAAVCAQSVKPGYVIITRNSIYTASKAAFAAFKYDKETNKGFKVYICDESEWAAGPGSTLAEKLRNWLIDKDGPYNIEYALLVGWGNPSLGNVPMMMCGIYPTDYLYAELDSMNPGIEIKVGRIPFTTSDDAAVLDEILNKTVEYTNASPSATAWRRKAILPVHPLIDDHAADTAYQFAETFKDEVLIPKNIFYHRIYQMNYGLFPPPEIIPCDWTTRTVEREWCTPATRQPFGIALWITHGCPTHAAEVMDFSSAGKMDTDHRAFVFSGSCSTGSPYEIKSLAYEMLKKGAVTIVAPTDEYVFEIDFPRTYFEKLITDPDKSAGEAFYETQLADPKGKLNLFGDPSVKLALPPANITLSPEYASYSFDAASGSFYVDTDPLFDWNAVTNAGWIHIVSGSGGPGPGTVSYTVDANMTADERISCIQVENQRFYISQLKFPEAVEIQTILTRISNADLAWGDFDNDGDMDLLQSGLDSVNFTPPTPVTELYRNEGPDRNGGTRFEKVITPSLAGVKDPALEWLDIDNDGNLDIIAAGTMNDGTHHVLVYQNAGQQGISGWDFDLVEDIPLKYKNPSRICQGDFDNDGDQDFSLIDDYSLKIFINFGLNSDNSTWIFHAYNTGCGGDDHDWDDIDGDGDFDLVTADRSRYILAYRNDGSTIGGGFNLVNMPITVSASVESAETVVLFDFDNDGDADLLRNDELYRNDGVNMSGDWIFTPMETGMDFIDAENAVCGDYNNDGTMDVFINGDVYRNEGSGGGNIWNFTNPHYQFPDMDIKNAEWVDFDNDGILDLSLTGPGTGREVRVLRNSSLTSANTAPLKPSNLSYSLSGNTAFFKWSAGSDTQTPSDGLMYNIYIGRTAGGIEDVSPLSDIGSGYRRVFRIGNAGQQTSWKIRDLPPGTWYWGVQTIDTAWTGSSFAQGGSFFIVPGMPDQRIFDGVSDLNSEGNALYTVDFDADGDLDVVTAGKDPAVITLYSNEGPAANGGNAFRELSTVIMATEYFRSDWGDFNNDGFPDIVVSGYYKDSSDNPDYIQIYKNNGTGTAADWSFTQVPDTFANIRGSADWVDFDNDGDLDLFFSGKDDSGNDECALYRNDGPGSGPNWQFTEITTGIDPLYSAATHDTQAEWFDFDGDGDLDLLHKGEPSASDIKRIQLYRNDGSAGPLAWDFVRITTVLPDCTCYSIDSGDYDNDGDPDICLSGYLGSGYKTSIFSNDNSGSGTVWDFTEIDYGFYGGDLESFFADYDNDGDLDLCFSGRFMLTPDYSMVLSWLYRNDLPGGFTSAGHISSETDLVWGDFDGDYDLDVFHGQVLYKNNTYMPNTRPDAPDSSSLSVSVSGNSATFSWGSGTDNQTPDDGLNYNIYAGITPGGEEIASPHADTAGGFRRIVHMGNTNANKSWTIHNLPAGTIYWGVQSIDSSFQGSSFAAGPAVTIDPAISGRVTLGGTGLAGVEIKADGISPGVFTDADGNYRLPVPAGFSGRVGPCLTGYAFSPAERNYTNVQNNIINQDYTAAVANLRLQYKTEQPDNTWNIQVVLFICNDGANTVNISDITAEYWYKSEWPDAETIEIDDARVQKYGTGGRYIKPWSAGAIQTVSPAQGGQDRKARISFSSGTGTLEPGAWMEIKFRVHDKAWRKRYNFWNDYSYGNHWELKDWTRITVKFLGSMVWGTEP